MVLPTIRAPAASNAATGGAVRAAGGCVSSHRGLPAPVTRPATSYRSLTAKVRPASGPLPLPGSSNRPCGQNAPTVSTTMIRTGSARRTARVGAVADLVSHAGRLLAITDRQPTIELAQRLLQRSEAPARREAGELRALHGEVHDGVLLAELARSFHHSADTIREVRQGHRRFGH